MLCDNASGCIDGYTVMQLLKRQGILVPLQHVKTRSFYMINDISSWGRNILCSLSCEPDPDLEGNGLVQLMSMTCICAVSKNGPQPSYYAQWVSLCGLSLGNTPQKLDTSCWHELYQTLSFQVRVWLVRLYFVVCNAILTQ